MITLPRSRVGAIAVASLLPLLSSCASATLGVTPETILATVIANLPAATGTTTTTTTSSGEPRSSRPERGGRIPERNIPESPPPSPEAASLLHTASEYIGVPYVWGGNTPRGFDCSGFTKFIYAKYHVSLPRTAREQARVGRTVPADFASLRPGDLMMFAEPGQAISHVAIYAGNGRILHASSSNHGVGYTDLRTGSQWFVDYFVVARRMF